MKTKILFVAIIILISFSACNDILKEKVDFNVSVIPSSGIEINGEEITIEKNTTVEFGFSGEPDFISFTYERFEFSNAHLYFSTQVAWGTHYENTLKVYLSDSFEGLTLDPRTDSISVSSHVWKDITDQCNLPTTTNTLQNASIDISEYCGKDLTIAFLYKPYYQADWQPQWTIKDLQIENTLKNSGAVFSTYLAATMRFTPFDILNLSDPYKSEAAGGTWSVETPASMEIRRVSSGNALNEDWLISKPIEIPLGVTDKPVSTAVKNISISVDSYSHTFTEDGIYTVSFYASNYNYKDNSSVERIFKIIVK